MPRHLAQLCCIISLVVFAGINSAQAQLLDSLFDETPVFGPRAGVNYQTKENGGDRFTDIRLFAPFGDEALQLFTDTRLLADREGEFGYNLGLGARGAIGADSMWGANLFADRRRTPFGIYNQIGFGWEAVVNGLEVRNNFYHPVGTDREIISESLIGQEFGDPFFQENFLKAAVTGTLFQQYEQALRGFDFEAGGLLYSNDKFAVRTYIGGYYFDNPGLTDAPGISGRLNLIASDNVELNAFVQHDRFFDTNGGVGITLYLGGGSTASNVSEHVRRVMGRPVYRRQMMTVAQGSLTRTEDLGIICLTNPETNSPLTITHVDSTLMVNGDGTFENPFNALPGTQPTDIVYLYSDSNFVNQQYTLAASQRLLGEGNGFVNLVDTVELGTIPLPAGNGAGVKPVISLDSDQFVITLADNSEVANLSLVQTSDFLGGGGINAAGITGGLLNSVMISTGGDSAFGVSAINSDLQIVDSMIATTGDLGFGLFSSGNSNVSLLNSSIVTTGDGADGVEARITSTVTLDHSSIQINGNGAPGVEIRESATVNLLNGSSITLGVNAHASALLALDSSRVTLDASSITTVADGAAGILARDSSIIEVLNGSSIVTSGSDAYGIWGRDNSTVTVDDSSIATMGSNAHGIFAEGMNLLTVQNGSNITATGMGSDALRFIGASGETNTLTALGSVFNSTSGAGVFVQTAAMDNTINATILGNTIDSADMLNFDVDIVLDNNAGGTLNIFGASDAADLRDNQNTADTIFINGTITFTP